MADKPVVVFVRETDRLTDEQVERYVAAQQIQVTRDFAPRWGLDATCVFAPTAYDIPDGAWTIILQDRSPTDGALGYHDDRGMPYSVVAVGDDMDSGVSWTITASHETLEMLADPNILKTVVADGFEYAFEVADAPEDDAFGYMIRDQKMSAFVLPSWFDPNGIAPFSFPAVPAIDAPFALAPGGYIGVRPVGGAWTQQLADGELGRRQVKVASSRTMRRFGS